MTNTEFSKAVSDEIDYCKSLLIKKGLEYAFDATSSETDLQAAWSGISANDRLASFKKVAALTGTTPKIALLGMMMKHIVSVSDMCMDNNLYTLEKWREKLTDSINYFLILYAMIYEETEDCRALKERYTVHE